MFNTIYQMILLFVLLGGFLMPGVRQVSGVQIYTAAEVEAVNGTDVTLKCTFSSSYPVSRQSVSVIWDFQPLNPGRDENVFFYLESPYPPTEGRFRNRVVWSGDVMEKDASITLRQVSPTFNGTYTCQVRNIPDVHGRKGEVVLRVVSKTASLYPYDLLMAIILMAGAGV
ncbi:myelin protein zero-like protein 2 [Anoplopoma fimbria]|uniref:myelin protein zero-like protein 2 n=1 Tax=Anoplopoma fimbria TaxID=229290 RepID=UPI0023ECBBE9|nr:myelin protein zero-like protein 2 [Anoplopoma fimbria]